MANGWTPERQAAQRDAIYRWRPWQKSTGPKTASGKSRAAGNALKHGARSRAALAEQRAIRKLLKLLGGTGNAPVGVVTSGLAPSDAETDKRSVAVKTDAMIAPAPAPSCQVAGGAANPRAMFPTQPKDYP